jgi:dihydrofolate synthase / folylpolyglutamate synthase
MLRTLTDWLNHAERLHPLGIDLGLERVTRVAERLGFLPPARAPAPHTIIVAGTNGKGSTSVAIEAILRAGGQRVGTTLSPHVHRFNERVRIDGRELDDAVLCEQFAAVESARGEITLSYFEFSTLVALLAFRQAAVDVAVLEVGLGGRLDAFNLVSADVAVITSIGLDHQQFLGNDLETIGREKAGVLRPGQRVVLGADVTASVVDRAAELGCRTVRSDRDFTVCEHAHGWDYVSPALTIADIGYSSVAPHNGALAIAAAASLGPVAAAAARGALSGCVMPGRFEEWRVGARATPLVLDVAHNPAGARFLRGLLTRRHPGRRFVALLGTLADKDAAGIAVALSDLVDTWVCVPTAGPRGQNGAALAARVRNAIGHGDGDPGDRLSSAADLASGLTRALSLCRPGSGILAFGSFNLVEQLRNLLAEQRADLLAEERTHSGVAAHRHDAKEPSR